MSGSMADRWKDDEDNEVFEKAFDKARAEREAREEAEANEPPPVPNYIDFSKPLQGKPLTGSIDFAKDVLKPDPKSDESNS